MELRKGSKIAAGRFKIERVLGQGGFGITYLAVHTVLEETVAIKEFFMKGVCERDGDTSQVTVSNVGNEELVSRYREKFLKEARNIYRLKHKNIITVTDVFEENGTAYYVMEHIDGGSLADKVRGGALPESVAVRYIRQVAEALDFVHSKRMMHLDVKPANILLDKEDNAVLIDFGLAKQYDCEGQQTSSTPVGISHGYAPIEQYKRGGVSNFSPATDIYSLGATLFKLVTGITPPDASDVGNEGLPVLPSDISPAVRGAIGAAMQFRVKDRPQSIAEFLAMLTERGNVKGESLLAHEAENRDAITPKDSSDPNEETVITNSPKDSSEETVATIDSTPSPVDAPSSSAWVFPKEKEAEPVKENATDDIGLKNFLWCIGLLISLLCLLATIADSGEQSDETIVAVEEQERLERDRIAQEQAAAEEQACIEREAEEHRQREEARKVDLGLSVYWAGWNVGASYPNGYGYYYAWGEIATKNRYNDSDYRYYDNGSYINIGNNICSTEYDVARAWWGGSWRMPTKVEFQELIDSCTWSKTTYNGLVGYKVTGPNGNSIFLPASGYCLNYGVGCRDDFGCYWSGSLCDKASSQAYYLYFTVSGALIVEEGFRRDGHTVRPVCDK